MATPTSAATTLHLGSRFATELPEMAIPWQADEVPEPTLIALNTRLAAALGLDPDWLRSPAGIRMLLGQDLPEAATPVAQAYTGHQFGLLAPRLGDGRALLLGELTAPDGTLRDIHLKGSGRTPFSRGGDGLAPLGPMLREVLVSESMHALGIPSTGSLAVLGTGRSVLREDGYHPGAVLVRTAASHLRVGSLEYARGLPDSTVLRRVADHAISRHHPEAADAEHPYRELLARVSAAQAQLVAQWMTVGFVHGVMNTDNMTLSGEGIDYGPCAFLDGFDRQAVFSSIDTGGRYAYGRQPGIAHWNLSRLAEAMLPLLREETDAAVDMAHEVLDTFPRDFGRAWTAGMRAKLGLGQEHDDQVVGPLANELLVLLSADRTDHTAFFRRLGENTENTTHDAGPGTEGAPLTEGAPHAGGSPLTMVGAPATGGRFADTVADPAALDAWLERWRALSPDPELMARSNPAYIPRNHRVDEALTAAESGDLEPFHALLAVLRDPFRERAGRERYAGPPPEGSGPTVTFCGT